MIKKVGCFTSRGSFIAVGSILIGIGSFALLSNTFLAHNPLLYIISLVTGMCFNIAYIPFNFHLGYEIDRLSKGEGISRTIIKNAFYSVPQGLFIAMVSLFTGLGLILFTATSGYLWGFILSGRLLAAILFCVGLIVGTCFSAVFIPYCWKVGNMIDQERKELKID